jgi:hypothetical protein
MNAAAELLRAIDDRLSRDDYTGALALIDQSRGKVSPYPGLTRREALCRSLQGDAQSAIRIQRGLVEQLPDSAVDANTLITWCVQTRDTTIRALLETWRTRLPDDPRFWLNEIRLLALSDEHSTRLDSLRRFVQAEPSSEEAWRRLLMDEWHWGGVDSLEIAIRGALDALPQSRAITRQALNLALSRRNLSSLEGHAICWRA